MPIMELKMHKPWKVAVAALTAVVLALLGISQIGGTTWTEAAAEAAAGWRVDISPVRPRPNSYSAVLVPAVLLLVILAASLIGAILRRRAEKLSDPVEPARD